MTSPKIIGDPYYHIVPYNAPIPIEIEENRWFSVVLYAKFLRVPLEHEEYSNVLFTNCLQFSYETLMRFNSTEAKVILQDMFAEVFLPNSVFFITNEIINYCKKIWDDNEYNLSIKVDVDVFVDELPQPKWSDDDNNYDEDEDYDYDDDDDNDDNDDDDDSDDNSYETDDLVDLIDDVSIDFMDDIPINFVAADEKSIEKLEKVWIKEDLIFCSICLEKVSVGLEVTRLPCTHTYHEKCIVEWLQISKFCPNCRVEIV
ncbi:phosphopantothenoylcysteine decarboxylase subunit SIS2-like [Cannabis sativa]|uniref:phosphopantothenoylcysteine decarboxylase subunit SIS2-like n=1 Tax=Cannabis sativa TaxID=3483 RepID=UPI0029CA7EFF|nr:phosphopantothenoylcysteine decarboxylase subunit SIS2-like [Cannabis sativa]